MDFTIYDKKRDIFFRPITDYLMYLAGQLSIENWQIFFQVLELSPLPMAPWAMIHTYTLVVVPQGPDMLQIT